jgi:hypothetical protein
MKPPTFRGISFAFLIGLLFAASVSAQSHSDTPKKTREQTYQRMNEVVDTKAYQEKLPFAKLLESLSKQLSREKKFTVKLDREAFGKDADKILNELVELPPVPTKMVANTALRLALSQTPHHHDYEIEFSAGPDELVITTRDRSLYAETYDISNILKHTRYLHETLAQLAKMHENGNGVRYGGPFSSGLDLKTDPDKADEWIVRQIVALSSDRAGWRNAKLPSTIQVLNGKKLAIHTSPSEHDAISSTLDAFRRLADLAVVMNARIYEIDRATYDKDFAPLFVDPKDKSARLPVAKINDVVLKKLTQQKLVLEAEPIKLRLLQQTVFVSFRSAHPYVVGPGDPDTGPALATVYDGFTWKVRPTVSRDRRCLRLELFQEAAQLLKITKGTIVDLKTGKDFSIDFPNVKKTPSSATIEIHDEEPILLAVDYRPAAKDRVWLLLAAPMIYMEAEQERLRRGAVQPMLLADQKPEAPDVPGEEFQVPVRMPAVELPNTDEMKQLLQAVVAQVMTDRELKVHRDRNGTRGDKKYALVNGDDVAWPKMFRPAVPDFTLQRFDPDECLSFKKRLTGLRLDTFKRLTKNPDGWEVVVEVTIQNAGGFANGPPAFKEACPVHCKGKLVGNGWVVKCEPRPFGAEIIE